MVRTPRAEKSWGLHVYFWVPNLIGYVRVALAVYGYAQALESPTVTFFCYMLSQLLDAADGYAARKLGQSSTFGAVLDMVTDRASTTCLCIVLANFYPEYILWFTSLVTLDMFSHWFHMYASLLQGLGSHKTVTNPLLFFYYKKPVLFLACAMTESWYTFLYLLAWSEGPSVKELTGLPIDMGLIRFVVYFCTPVFVFKQVANLVQMRVACDELVARDEVKAIAKKTQRTPSPKSTTPTPKRVAASPSRRSSSKK